MLQVKRYLSPKDLKYRSNASFQASFLLFSFRPKEQNYSIWTLECVSQICRNYSRRNLWPLYAELTEISRTAHCRNVSNPRDAISRAMFAACIHLKRNNCRYRDTPLLFLALMQGDYHVISRGMDSVCMYMLVHQRLRADLMPPYTYTECGQSGWLNPGVPRRARSQLANLIR